MSCYLNLYLPDRTSLLSRLECAVAGGNDCSVVLEGQPGLLTEDVLTPSSVVKLVLAGSDTNLNIRVSLFGVSVLEETYSPLWRLLPYPKIQSPVRG